MPTLAEALDFVKRIDLKKVQGTIETAGNGLEIASAALRNPEVALAGLLKLFARNAMGEELTDAGSRDLAKMVIGKIKKRRPKR